MTYALSVQQLRRPLWPDLELPFTIGIWSSAGSRWLNYGCCLGLRTHVALWCFCSATLLAFLDDLKHRNEVLFNGTASVLVLLARKQLISGSTDSLSQIGVLKTKVVVFFVSSNLTPWTMYTSYGPSNILRWAALPSLLIEKKNKMCTFRLRTSTLHAHADGLKPPWLSTDYSITQIGPHKTGLTISALVWWWIQPLSHKRNSTNLSEQRF